MFIISLLICTLLYVFLKAKTVRHPPLPPGPPAEPLIGHLRLIPPDNQEMLFYKWGKKYGDIIHLHFLGRSVVILNSVKAAVDLLDKRGSIYSDRPRFVFFDMMGWEYGVFMMGYGRRFQRHRRMMQTYLAPSKCTGYQPAQSREARVLLQNLIGDSENRDKFLRRFSTAVIMRVAYGHQITSDDDPYVRIAEDTGFTLTNGGPPGSTPIDFFPILRKFPAWFPGAYYAGFARDYKWAVDKLQNYPFEEVSAQMAEGKANPSFLSTNLEAHYRDGPNSRNTIEDIKGAAGQMYCAASDTTWSSLSIFFLAMTLNPEAQKRAQKEIDDVIGPARLPEFRDRKMLPYVECVLQETLRWNVAVPLGVPHRVLEDDVYEGMFIPKGSLVIANARAMTLDKKVYGAPTTFDPTRFLPKPEGRAEPYPNGPFGFGRRICPGRHLADASLWIAIASTLATLDIGKALDSKGKEITPEVSFISGITNHPRPYRCTIQPRNEVARALIEQGDISDVV